MDRTPAQGTQERPERAFCVGRVANETLIDTIEYARVVFALGG